MKLHLILLLLAVFAILVNGASISSESNSSESDSNEDDRIPYSRVRQNYLKDLSKIKAKIEKEIRKSEEELTKDTAEEIEELQEDFEEAQQKLEKNLKKTSADLSKLSSPECTADSKLVKLTDKLNSCYEGTETQVLTNADQGLRLLGDLTKRYSHIEDSLKDCDRIRNDQAAKKCAEGKVGFLFNFKDSYYNI
ncbi:hypothetical protein ACFFRR_006697 [Megaselia abdita]